MHYKLISTMKVQVSCTCTCTMTFEVYGIVPPKGYHVHVHVHVHVLPRASPSEVQDSPWAVRIPCTSKAMVQLQYMCNTCTCTCITITPPPNSPFHSQPQHSHSTMHALHCALFACRVGADHIRPSHLITSGTFCCFLVQVTVEVLHKCSTWDLY